MSGGLSYRLWLSVFVGQMLDREVSSNRYDHSRY
jgi:hypothetical protein